MNLSKCIFVILSVWLLICNIIYNNITLVGPITYRHVATIMLLGYLLLQGADNLKVDIYFRLFFIFVFFWGVGSFYTGYGIQFINKFLGTTINAFITYQATKILISKFDALHFLVITLIFIGIIDSSCTILQFYNKPLGYIIPKILDVDFIHEYEEFANRRLSSDNTAFVIPGIIGGAAHGYFTSCMTVMSLYPFKGRLTIVNIALWALFLMSLFFIQERTAFVFGFIGSFYVLYYMIKYYTSNVSYAKKIFVKFIGVCVAVFLVYKLYGMLDSIETRYVTLGTDTQGRNQFISNAFDYLSTNPLGGYFEYSESGAMPPHNLFVNALLWGGVIGGPIVIIMILKQIKLSVSSLSFKSKDLPHPALLFAVIFLVYTGNSLLHNESVVNGSSIIWMYWAVFITYLDNK